MSTRGPLVPLVLVLLVATAAPAAGEPQDSPAEESDPVAALIAEAEALRPFFDDPFVRAFLDATERLPPAEPRRLWKDPQTGDVHSEADAEARPDDVRARLQAVDLPADYTYTTRYGSPLAFSRALAVARAAGFEAAPGDRIVDFGFGSIGQLRLLAELGLHAVGLDVDPTLGALYSAPGDTGAVIRTADAPPDLPPAGSVEIAIGRFPVDEHTVTTAGEGARLFISKNTLKRGYIHPDRPVDPRRTIDLGVEDDAFVAAVHRTLAPGGWFVIYNLHPAPAAPDEPYVPWADGRSPFSREDFEGAGFEVLVFDRDDTSFARKMGSALGWGASMDLEADLFATFTVARRRAVESASPEEVPGPGRPETAPEVLSPSRGRSSPPPGG